MPDQFVPKILPEKYRWLSNEGGPKVLTEALRHYGLIEHVGQGSNIDISRWAKELGVDGFYTDDDIPWCGLFVGVVVSRSGYEIPKGLKSLGARNWIDFGTKINPGQEKLFDVLVFKRPGGGHVGFYVGENNHAFLVYGGNQSNAVGFAWIDKNRLVGARRCPWKVGQPANIRKILLTEEGVYSKNEE